MIILIIRRWTKQIKERIDKTQQNSKCRLCGDRDETINHIISDAANSHRRCIRLDTTVWAKWSTEWCARNLNLTIRTNGKCTTQQLSSRMTHTDS